MDKNQNAGAAIGVGAIVACIYVLAVVAFWFLVLYAFVCTFACICAWNKPIGRGKARLVPSEARAFVHRGFIGACLLPVFCFIGQQFFGWQINGDYVAHIVVSGYMAGSIGFNFLYEPEESVPEVTIIPPDRRLPPPGERGVTRVPFRFASWEDEDGR